MSLLLRFIVAPTNIVKKQVTKATVPTGVLCFPLRDVWQAIPRKWHPEQWDCPPLCCLCVCVCVCSVHRGTATCERPSSVCTPRARHIYITVRVPLWCMFAKSLFRGSLHYQSFFFLLFFFFFLGVFFCSYVSVAPLLKTGSPQR